MRQLIGNWVTTASRLEYVRTFYELGAFETLVTYIDKRVGLFIRLLYRCASHRWRLSIWQNRDLLMFSGRKISIGHFGLKFSGQPFQIVGAILFVGQRRCKGAYKREGLIAWKHSRVNHTGRIGRSSIYSTQSCDTAGPVNHVHPRVILEASAGISAANPRSWTGRDASRQLPGPL